MADARDRAAASLQFLTTLGPRTLAVKGPYVIQEVVAAGQRWLLRPVNTELFITDADAYLTAFAEFEDLLVEVARDRSGIAVPRKAAVRGSLLISRVLYTTLQATGCAMDCLLTANASRKNYGMRFEELMSHLLAAAGVAQDSIQFSLPYTNPAGGTSYFVNQVDLVISEREEVASHPAYLDPDEVVVSLKTSSKDRFAKIFLDQEMLSFVTGRPIKVVALFHNDIQRQGERGTSGTFVAGNFAAYVARFGPLTGVYYVDPPVHIAREPWSDYLRTYEDLLLDDLWTRIF